MAGINQLLSRTTEDSGASDYRDLYLPDRPEKGYEFYRVAFVLKA